MKQLTPLGVRTLAGFEKQFGPDGPAKFRNAIDKGLIDGAKMESAQDAAPAPAKSGPKPPGSTGRAAAGTFQARPG